MTNLSEFIQELTDIKNKIGGDVPVMVNMFGTSHVVPLQMICIDNDMGADDTQLLLEADIENMSAPTALKVYTTGEEI